MINSELVDAVRAAMTSQENLTEGGRVNWDFVEADLYLDFLDTLYRSKLKFGTKDEILIKLR